MTGPPGLWAGGGSGTPLAVLAYAWTVVHASLAAMTDNPDHTGRTDGQHRELADIPAIEIISRVAVMLMSAAAEKIGLAAPDPDVSEHRDLDEARRLINAYAGLLDGCAGFLGPHAGPMKDGLRSLQLAFREASAAPDEPGQGPGEKFTGPVG